MPALGAKSALYSRETAAECFAGCEARPGGVKVRRPRNTRASAGRSANKKLAITLGGRGVVEEEVQEEG